jgi:hypothetical protein
MKVILVLRLRSEDEAKRKKNEDSNGHFDSIYMKLRSTIKYKDLNGHFDSFGMKLRSKLNFKD